MKKKIIKKKNIQYNYFLPFSKSQKRLLLNKKNCKNISINSFILRTWKSDETGKPIENITNL